MTHAGGRPPIFKTVEELQAKIDEYFNYCDNRVVQGYDAAKNREFAYVNPEPYTMSGLAYSMGIDRKTLLNYKDKDEFFPTIKAARDKVEKDVERRLLEGKATTGAIFNLKNNFGWKDETKQDITSNGESLQPILVKFIDGKNNRNTS